MMLFRRSRKKDDFSTFPRKLVKKLLKLKGVSSITREDKELFDMLSGRYARSWPYAVLLGETMGKEGLGLKFHNQDSLVTIGSHNGHICVVPNTQVAPDKLVELVSQIYELVGSPVYVKGITAPEKVALCDSGFQDVYVPQGSEELILGDDAFPHVILSTRRTIDSVKKPDICEHDELLSFERAPLATPSDKYSAKLVILDWATSGKSNVDGYIRLIDTFEPRKDYFTMIYSLDGISIGFFLAKKISEDTAALYVNVASRHATRGRSRHQASRLFLLDFLEHLGENRIDYVNWGGSETSTLHAFKSSFNPVSSTPGVMMEYNPHHFPRKDYLHFPTMAFLSAQRFRAYDYYTKVLGAKILVTKDVYPVCDDTVQVAKYFLGRVIDGRALDMGCGTGFLALCAKQAGAEEVDAVDISKAALSCAEYNLDGTGINIFQSDCFSEVEGRYDYIIAHLPYESGNANTELERTVFDPGFRFRRRFFEQAPEHLNPDGRIIISTSKYSGGRETIERFSEDRFNLRRVGGNNLVDVYELRLK